MNSTPAPYKPKEFLGCKVIVDEGHIDVDGWKVWVGLVSNTCHSCGFTRWIERPGMEDFLDWMSRGNQHARWLLCRECAKEQCARMRVPKRRNRKA